MATLDLAPPGPAPAAAPQRSLNREDYKTLGLSALGGTLEFYDFVVFVFFANVIGALFFPAAMPDWLRQAIALALVASGLVLDLRGALAFRRARTTVNPLAPGKTSAIVATGVYRITRNPMYLGMLAMLMGVAVFLAAPAALLGPGAFVAYITRFQILPEERALTGKFGEPYLSYCRQVRRWL